jgi:hypothetical protein
VRKTREKDCRGTERTVAKIVRCVSKSVVPTVEISSLVPTDIMKRTAHGIQND